MDKTTLQNLTDKALTIAGYAAIAGELRQVADLEGIEPKQKKRLQAIAKLLEREVPDQLFNPAILRSLRVYQLLASGEFISDEAIAKKLECSQQTAKQTINALRNGGIELQEQTAKGYKVTPTGGRPPKGRAIA